MGTALTRRLRFLLASLRRGFPPVWSAAGIGTILVGGSLLAAVQYGLGRWEIGLTLLAALAALVGFEGAFRLLSDAELAQEAQLGSAQDLAAAALLLRTELLDICHKVEMFRVDPIIPVGFDFPASEWERHRGLVARQPDLYAVLVNAYTLSHRANQIFAWRRTASTSRLVGVNLDSDDLDAVHSAARDAVEALDVVIDPARAAERSAQI